MICQWQSFLKLLPNWLKEPVDRHGRDTLNELRLRLGERPELVTCKRALTLDRRISGEDLRFCVSAATQYSPWAATSIIHGYITAPGGHRIGICGVTVEDGSQTRGFRLVTSLCIRVARDFPGIAAQLPIPAGSILIIGPPGCGKTTLLRDLIRQISGRGQGGVAVVDERGEIFPVEQGRFSFSTGPGTDVLTGLAKSEGIISLIRCMSPSVIAVDEITAQADCDALLKAGWCGVRILATAHAGSKEDLYCRPVYRPLLDAGLFDSLVILQQDKSWIMERI